MSDTFAESLRAWHDFFILTGTAAATLMGLVFVAVSLAGSGQTRAAKHTIATFVSPIVFHFGHVLLLAAGVVVPTHTAARFGVIALGLGLAHLCQVLAVLRGMIAHHRAQEVDRAHWVWHFLLPLVASVSGAGAAVGILSAAPWAMDALAGSVVLLLLVGVTNAWTLVTWILEHRDDGVHDGRSAAEPARSAAEPPA
jgi:hypothetical protein